MKNEYPLEMVTYVTECDDLADLEYLLDSGFHIIHVASEIYREEGAAGTIALYSLGWYGDKAEGATLWHGRPSAKTEIPDGVWH